MCLSQLHNDHIWFSFFIIIMALNLPFMYLSSILVQRSDVYYYFRRAADERISNYMPPVKLLTSLAFYTTAIKFILNSINNYRFSSHSHSSSRCRIRTINMWISTFNRVKEMINKNYKIYKHQWQILRDHWHCKGCCLPKHSSSMAHSGRINNKWFHFIVGNACHIWFWIMAPLYCNIVIDLRWSTVLKSHT